MIANVDADDLRIVNVVHSQTGFSSPDDALVVTYHRCRRLDVGHHTVFENKGGGVLKVHTGIGLRALGKDTLYLGIAEHTYEIDGIDTHIQEGTATEIGTENALLMKHGITDGSSNELWLADSVRGQKVLNHLQGWLIACPDGLCNEHLALTGQIDDFLTLSVVSHESLLHKTGFALEDGFPRHLEVMTVGCGDIGKVHIGIVKQLGIGAVSTLKAPLGGEFLCLFE